MSETQVTTDTSADTDNLDTFADSFFGEKQKAEPAAKLEEVAQEGEEAGEVAAEAQTDEPDPNEDAEAEFKEAPPKKKTVQDRIDEVVRQREDQRREFETKLAALEARLADKTPVAPVAKTDEPGPNDLLEDGSPKYELGEFDPQYIRDLTKFTFAQERTQSDADAQKAALQVRETEARQVLTTEWNGRVEAAKAEYPDFQEKATVLLDGFGSLDQNYAGYLSTVLMQMDHGTDVLYYLSNNPEEATKIVNSGAQKATLALGRIEAKFYEAAQTKLAAKPKVSSAPTPPPMRTRGTNGAFISVAPDTDDLDAFAGEFFVKRK